MKKLSHSALAATLAVLGANSVYADQTSHVYGLHDRSTNHFALMHATVFVEPGKSIKNATLVIDNGRIVSVKANGKVPSGATEIDLTSHIVYPGFIDPYSNYATVKEKKVKKSRNDGPKYTGVRKGGNSWNNAVHAEIDWVEEFKADPKVATAFTKNGYTAVQTAKLDGIFQGQGVTVSLSNGLPNDLIYNSHASHFGSFDKGSSKQEYPSSLMGSMALIRQTLSDASWYQSAKGKTDNLNTGQLVEYNRTLDSISEIEKSGLIFNADDYLSTLRADKLFDQFEISASFVADGHEYARINEIKETNATFILPLTLPAKPDVTSYEAQLDVSLGELRHWERAPTNASVLARNKIPFAFTQHGLKKPDQFWTKLRTLVKHGLSEKDALAALTTVPAKLAGINRNAGKIATGMFADIVVTDGNIFDDGMIKSVWMQGKETNFSAIQPATFAGKYAFDVSGAELTLELTKKDTKVTGKLLKDEKKSSIKVSVNQDNSLLFSADLAELGLPGVYRFSGRLIDDKFVGVYLEPNAKKVTFSAAKSELDNKEKDESSEQQALTYLSQVTSPNRAFGLTNQAKQQNVLIKNATIWTSEKQGVLEGADLLVKKGKISKIGKGLKAPKGYLVIEGKGKHVTAGIIDEHSHIAISKGVNEGSDAITSEVRIGDVVNPDDINIYRALAGGTTTAQLLHGSANPVGGQAQVIKLRWGATAEKMMEKRAPGSIKFALGENVKQSNWGDKFTIRYPQTRMGVETIVRDAFTRAQDYQASWDKYERLSRSKKKLTSAPRKDYRMDALVEIMDQQRFVHSHSYVASEILSLMNIAEDFDFRIQTFTHILEGYKVADEMAKHGASGSTFSDWWAYKFEVLDAIPMNTCLMMDRGVNVSVNSDSGDLIRRLNTEAAKSVQHCGMSQENALNMVTINPAKQLKIDQYTGSLKKGKDADFVIWSGHPLSIYSKVEQTWIDGTNYFNRSADLEARKAIAAEKNQLIQKLLTEAEGKKKGTDASKLMKPSKSTEQVYLLKDEAQWHCDDNFDFWQWKSNQNGGQL
ncbi:MAG: amidohydrolase family protein [Kangiellaceae bacterium]|nr:amidohydrolase family protein [Kangiellaceae bacterium]